MSWNERIDPFKDSVNFGVNCEHFERYRFAKKKCFGRIIDIGCGSGYGTKMLKATGIDKIKPAYDIDFYNCDIDEVFPNVKTDCSVCFETLEHVKNPQKLLISMYNAMRDKGICILSVPNQQYEPKRKGKSTNKFHLHLFDKQKITSMVEKAGFTSIQYFGQPLSQKLFHYLPNCKITWWNKWLSPFLGYPKKDTTGYSIIIMCRKCL